MLLSSEAGRWPHAPEDPELCVKALTKDCQGLLELFISVKYKKKKLSETKS